MDETARLGDLSTPSASVPTRADGPHWGVFGVLCLAYFVTTTGEQMLSPLFPTVSDDLGLSVTQGGIAFAVLTGSIAITSARPHDHRSWLSLMISRAWRSKRFAARTYIAAMNQAMKNCERAKRYARLTGPRTRFSISGRA